jgi:hypothetical protein
MKKINKNLNNFSIINTKDKIETHLPTELKSIFIGIMLGDGSLYRSSLTSATQC